MLYNHKTPWLQTDLLGLNSDIMLHHIQLPTHDKYQGRILQTHTWV